MEWLFWLGMSLAPADPAGWFWFGAALGSYLGALLWLR